VGLLEAARDGTIAPVVLVAGDRALAEPAADRLAGEIAGLWGVEPQRTLHPASLAELTEDLRTVALFEPGKLVVAIETGLLADRSAASELVQAIRSALPFQGGADDLVGPPRAAARRLLQLLRLHDLDPAGGSPEQVLAALPGAALLGGRGKAADADALRGELRPLLVAALEAGLRGVGEEDLTLVSDLVRGGLPDRHLLILVESAVAPGHPLVEALAGRGAVIDAGRVASDKKEFQGLGALVAELERSSGARIERDAAAELARRTLRLEDFRRGGGKGAIEADSTARLAAEFRKLAMLAGGGRIDRALVEDQVEDRGREEVWPITDALAEGNVAKAVDRALHRIATADDPVGERLGLFAFLSGFARQVVAAGGAMALTGAPAGESFYPRFKSKIAPRIKGELPGGLANPLAKVSEFPLHKAYLVASRLPAAVAARLPSVVLETEQRLKGEGDDPDAALVALLAALAGPVSSGQGARRGSRARAGGGGRS